MNIFKLVKPAKRLVFSSCLAGILSMSACADMALNMEIPVGSLTIEEAFSIALERNPRIDEVESRIQKAEAQLSKAKTFLFPSLNLNAGYQAITATDEVDWLQNVRVTENLNKFNAGVTMGWRIFDGLRSLHYLRAARSQLVVTEYLHQDAQRVLLEQVAGAFVQSQLAVENMRISRSSCEFNERLYQNAQFRYRRGATPEADVLNFSLALTQARSNFKRAERDYKVACSIIAQLLAFENGKLPQGRLPLVDIGDKFDAIPSYDSAISLALQNRPDVQAAEEGIRAIEHQRKGVKAAGLPNVDLVGGVRYNKAFNSGRGNPDENDRNIGVVMNWNLFDGGRRKAEEIEVKMQRRELEAQSATLEDYVASQIQQILTDLETTQFLLEQQVQAESDVVKIRDFVEKAYNAGSSNITRLNEVQNNWVQVSGALASIRLQHHLNEFRLKSTTGEILEPYLRNER